MSEVVPILSKADPVDEALAYVRDKWVQNITPMRTACFRCGVDSPIIHVPLGTIAFGVPVKRGETDVTRAVQLAFDKIGWKFQNRRSYCTQCRNLGSVG
jgi:hypothetical protein